MLRFLLLISGIILSLFIFLSDKEGFLGAGKTPDTQIQNTNQSGTTTFAQKTRKESAATTSPEKSTPPASPAVSVLTPAKKAEPITPQKIVPKVAPETTVPLVHYVGSERAPNTLLSSEVSRWTNTYREQNGIKALQRNSKLDTAAIIKVHDMFNLQYFEHVSPSGKNSADLVSGIGYEYLWVGENLALGIFSDEKDLVDAWMASPGHRANILNSHFEEIGVGVEEGTYEGKHVWLAVQEFGKPASSCPAPEVSVKVEIEQDRTKIEELSIKANVLISEMDALKKDTTDTTAYNQKVIEYNAVVNELNPFIQKMKSLVTVYNQEISTYNSCIEE